MCFTVEWTTPEGPVSAVVPTARGAYQEAERVTKLGMRDVRIRFPNGDHIDWQTFSGRSGASNQTSDGMTDLD
jgi:hypothetical protein